MPRFVSQRHFLPFGEPKIAMWIANWLTYPTTCVIHFGPIQAGNHAVLPNFLLVEPTLPIARMLSSNTGSLEPIKLL